MSPRTSRSGSGRARSIRRWRWGIGLFLLLALALLSRLDRAGRLLVPRTDDLQAYDGVSARVIRVIDGDTFDVDLPDALNDRSFTRVRLWGLDCPEVETRDHPGEPWADEATAFTRDLVDDASVTLHLESHRERGTFGRVLAHVEIPNRGSLNLLLLEAGLARADDRWPHRHLERYAAAERDARRDRRGMWGPAP